MNRWQMGLLAVAGGAALTLLGERMAAPRFAQAQNLSKFQNVAFDFDTTGQASTLTFFNRDTGEIVLYVAGAGGDFKAARRLTMTELGAPLTPSSAKPSLSLPQLQLPQGTESFE